MDLKDIDDTFANDYLVYNRRSTDDANNQRNSLSYQRLRNLEYVGREKLSVANLTIPGFCTNGIIDESHSAFKQEEEFVITEDGSIQYRILRPKFLTLVGLLQGRKIKGVVFLCMDRASRNDNDLNIINRLKAAGRDMRFVEANYENTSSGKLHMRMDGMFASHFSEVISEKVKNAQAKLRSEKRVIYGAPVGYLDLGSDNKPLDPERAPIVKRIFELYATGEWSIRQLAKWAREQGLTKKPVRRKRTKEEIANNVDVASIPKHARPVDHKTIEYMLPNPFYIGKVKIGDRYEDSSAHQALIDRALFNTVQDVLKKKRVSVYYVDKEFYTYRELAYCVCGRAYSPYVQKGIVYYRTRCKDGCENTDQNLSDKDITAAIQRLLDQVHFSDEEKAEIERDAKKEFAKIAEQRDQTLADLQAKQRNILADVDYLVQNKISLLRGGMDMAAVMNEQQRLETKLVAVNQDIASYSQSAPEMLKYILTFSELVKHAGIYFRHALDSEKREIATLAFTELVFKDRELVGYTAHDGFDALLKRRIETVSKKYSDESGELTSGEVTGSAWLTR